MRYILWCLLIFPLIIAPIDSIAEREIPENNLTYPVLISLSSGTTGSGFFLNTKNSTFLITASHVLFDKESGNLKAESAKLLSYPKDLKENERNIFVLDLTVLNNSKNIHKHLSEDVTAIQISVNEDKEDPDEKYLKLVTGVVAVEKATFGILGVGFDNIKPFKDVLTANTIYVFGYPTSIGIKEIPQIDPLRPLLRYGIVAGTNPKKKTIIIDCPSYLGNSGGPVLEVENVGISGKNFRVIGVVSQFVPFAETWVNTTHQYTNLNISNSGYTVVVSMDPVIELVSEPQN